MLKNYAVSNVQCSEFFIFILRNPSQRLHLTVFLKAFISKGVRYLTVKKSSIEQYINWYGHDLLCIPITSCSFLHNERKWWPQLSLVPIRLHCTDEIRVSSWCSWNGVSLIHCLPLSLSHTQMVLCIYFQCPFRARAMNWPFHPIYWRLQEPLNLISCQHSLQSDSSQFLSAPPGSLARVYFEGTDSLHLAINK